MKGSLNALEEWFLENCDGDWEHSWGIDIHTLDNPGWSVAIDLKETIVENKPFDNFEVERSDDDWVYCRVEGKIFKGYGGPQNLEEILSVFNEWRRQQRSP